MRGLSGRLGQWLGVVTLGFGVLGALVTTHLVALLALGALSVMAAEAVTSASRPSELLAKRGVRTRWASASLVASAMVGALGAFAGFGPSGLLLWLVLLTAAWLLADGVTLAPRAVTPGGAGPDGPDGPADTPGPPRPAGPVGRVDGSVGDQERLAGLSDSELCWAWRNSYFAAQHAAADPDRLDRISRTRRGYLDEIQRRDPPGFAAWLDAGARAASNPARYWKSDA